MIRGSTPTLTFTLPFDASGVVKDLRITFNQDETVLEKRLADCTLDGTEFAVTLSQKETLLFNHEKVIKIQVKIKCIDGNVLVSDPQYKFCHEVFNEEIL